MDLVKMSRIQMIFWFIATGVTLVLVTILFFQDKVESFYFLVPLIPLGVALLRRWQWQRLTKSSAERDAREAQQKGKGKKKR